MKKLVFPLLVLVLILAACGNKSDSDKKEETKSYKLDSGKSLDIPKNPERIAVVAPTYAGVFKLIFQ